MYDNSDKNCDVAKVELIKMEIVNGKVMIKYRRNTSNSFQEEQRFIYAVRKAWLKCLLS